MYNCVSIWAPNQVEWPRPIRSELHVESLKRPKHAVHDEWLGSFLTEVHSQLLEVFVYVLPGQLRQLVRRGVCEVSVFSVLC